MLQELCRGSFYNVCNEIVTKDRIRLISDKSPRQFTDFFTGGRFSYNWKVIPLNEFGRGRGGIQRKNKYEAWAYFNDVADKLREHYLRVRWGRDLKKAMTESGTFEKLFEDFYNYFEGRKARFMEQTEKLMDAQAAALAAKGKRPQSHGGVANLLKVLTKTMHDQGSSIYTIAKTQYVICMQAGIYLPDEFLTDVLVAHEMIEEG